MSVYYVTHPNLGISAAVEAPTTEKARTTFLDYLERQGGIRRSDRQFWRKNMVTERLEDPQEIVVDVELHYGYESGGGGVPPSMSATPVRGELVGEEEVIPYSGEMIEVPLEEEQPKKLSPIAKVSLGVR